MHRLLGDLPAVRGSGGVIVQRDVRIAQSLDGESAPGDFQVDAGDTAQDLALAGLPLAFDELQEEHAHAIAGGAHGQADGRGSLALAVTGKDQG